MNQKIIANTISEVIKSIDEKLSKRKIELDPKGYFIIRLDFSSNEILLEHYTNDIDSHGRATNPETGKPLRCQAEEKRSPLNIYKGRSAKEVGVQITESIESYPLSKLDHALYLGRELQRAEECLKNKTRYIQD